jgi:SAM-dependent methyltransferase
MPTILPRSGSLPHGNESESADEPHRQRQIAESFGLDPARYDRTRPSYPDGLVQAIIARSPGPEFLDVGCGTGIAARQFQAAGCRVLGVDVDARMAEVARRQGLEVEVGAFESWDCAGRSFDALIAGQTWHWVEPVAGAAKAALVLRPGGRLAVFWNMFQPADEVAEAFAAVYRRVMPDLPYQPWRATAPDANSNFFTRPAEGIRATRAFTDPEHWHFPWQRSYSREEWLDQLPTAGGHNRLAPATLNSLLAGIGAAIDAMGGSFPMRYDAVAITALRNGHRRTRS